MYQHKPCHAHAHTTQVILPMQLRDCIVVLKEWNFIHCSMYTFTILYKSSTVNGPTGMYGNYLEIETLVCVEEGHSHTLQRLMPGEGGSYLSVTEVQRHIK